MKCFYYLAPTLDDTHQISVDLREAGVHDWFLHIVSKDEAGLKREKLHSSNYLETLDLMRGGFIGANIGFIVGAISAGLLMYFQPFGDGVPNFVYLLLVILATLLGAWEGGLVGVESINQKLKRFNDEIEAGQYLILIYARKGQGELVKEMMVKHHPEAQHVATDKRVVNPFAVVHRKRGQRQGQSPATS